MKSAAVRTIPAVVLAAGLLLTGDICAQQSGRSYYTSYKLNDTGRTVGLFMNGERSYNGYTLFAPLNYYTTYLIDNDGYLVNSWDSDYEPGNTVYLLENGNLLRAADPWPDGNPYFNAGGKGGRVEEFTWDGTLAWEFEYASEQYLLHHDIEALPSGNVLMIAWEYKSDDDALAAGRDPLLLDGNGLWPEHVIEVEPDADGSGGTIVWQWHAWDHLIQDYDFFKDNYGMVEDHPELIDLNYVHRIGADWIHMNAIDYNEDLDQILLNTPFFKEFWVIDHSTTTGEAAGHTGGNSGMGGDLLYRWGNPQAYRAGDESDQMLFGQHDAEWIGTGLPGEGDILVFNNGRGRPDLEYSSVDEIIPPVDIYGNYFLQPDSAYGPDGPVWSYTANDPTNFYSSFLSGSQRLPNGNTLICEGLSGKFFEVTPEGYMVWMYINPVISGGPMNQGAPLPGGPRGGANSVFRADRYSPDFPGFEGKDMTPGDPVEQYPPFGIAVPAP